MRKVIIVLLGVLSAAFPITSCSTNPEKGIVNFKGRKIDIASHLTEFPYSSYVIKMSKDCSKLFYLHNGDTARLVMLDLNKSKNLDDGVVICDEDFSKKSFWSHRYNSADNCLYWIGDERNDEIINLYRLNIETHEITKLTDVPYIYGWDMNEDGTKVAYIARLGQNENRLDELHILDLRTLEDTLVYTDKADFRLTWSEISFNPQETGVTLTVLKDADRTFTNAAFIDFKTGKLQIITDPSKEASLDGTAVISPWYSDNLAYFHSNQTGFSNLYAFDSKTGKTTQITHYNTDISVNWIESEGKKRFIGVQSFPTGTRVVVIDPVTGKELSDETFDVSMNYLMSKENKAYFSVGSVDILYQLWSVAYSDGKLVKEVVLELPKEKNYKLITSTAEKLSIPTFDTDPATGKKRELHAYLMIPRNPLPKGEEMVMIQSFYGGGNSYDVEHQIFTDAGIYVLSPAPRGSSGFGRDFAAMNDGDLGGNEIIDIIYCAIFVSEKLGIPAERIGVFGMSHGGYATMRLMTFPGEVNGNSAFFPFGFGVAVAGFADIIYQYHHSNIPDWITLEAGDPVKDIEQLMDRSPVSHADKITGPLLLIHGNHDERVNIEGSRVMYNALTALGKPVEFLEIEGQGHGYKGLDNNVLYYQTIFSFLEKKK